MIAETITLDWGQYCGLITVLCVLVGAVVSRRN